MTQLLNCRHLRTQMMKVICTNGAVQVRQICLDCNGNARGTGVNVPHAEIADLSALPILQDNRSPGDADPADLLWK